MSTRILVIDDEPQMLRGLRDNLEIEGYDVTTAANGEEGLAKALGVRPDLVILDLMLPRKSGFDVCRELRDRRLRLPIIMLTARTRETDKVLGLELGADDYLTKPFSLPELLARIRAVLRRTHPTLEPPDAYTFGDVSVNFRTHRALKGDEPLSLTSREFDLLQYLIARRGEVVTREELLSEVWGYDGGSMTRTMDNFVSKLRQKIERTPHQPEFILTIHGAGYKFVA